jgi:hypothetical protein
MLVTVALKAFYVLIRLTRSFRYFSENCAISFFRLRLVLHACVQTFDVIDGGKKFWKLNQAKVSFIRDCMNKLFKFFTILLQNANTNKCLFSKRYVDMNQD